MEITLRILLYFLRDLNPMVAKQMKKAAFFIGTHQLLLTDEQQGELPGTLTGETYQYLYVSALSELVRESAALPADRMVLASRDCELSDEELGGLPCGLVLVDGKYTVPYLLNRMINVFHFLTVWDKNMHIATLEGKGVQELIDLSEEVLEHPTIIFDVGFDVLAYTRRVSCEYSYFQDTIRKGYTDPKTMNLIKEQNIFSKLQKGDILVASAVGDASFTNVHLVFHGDQNILGYACVSLGREKADPGYLDLLRIFAVNMTFCLRKNYEDKRFGRMMYETFLLNLMNPAGASPEQVSEQIQNLEGLSEEGQFLLGVLDFADTKNASLPFLARQISNEMWDVKPFIYDDKICLLRIFQGERLELEAISNEEIQRMGRILQRYTYTFGISNEFQKIVDLPYAFRQASAAITFGSMQGRQICMYRDYYYFDLFRAMEAQMPATHFRMGLYQRLKEYDEENHTRYCPMILTYLKCDCNATHAAEKLFLHRNTIRKAVQFVEEKWDVSLADTEQKKCMVMGELADQYLELMHPE